MDLKQKERLTKMKKHIVSFLFAFLFIFSSVGSVGAASADIPDFSDQDRKV